MSWVAVAIGGAAVIGGGVAMYEGSQNRDAAKEARDAVAGVQYQTDPYVAKTQDFAFPYYTDMLNGKINDYYAPIGQTGSQAFEDMLGLTTRDITNSTNENLVRRGMSRSGVGADIVSRNVGDASTKLRYEDFNRALTGKLNLLNIGSQGLSGVRSAAITNQANLNAFNVSKMGGTLNAIGIDNQQQQADAQMWGDIMGSGVSAASSYYGMNTLKDIYGTNKAPNTMTSGLGTIDYTKLIGAMGNQGNAFTNYN